MSSSIEVIIIVVLSYFTSDTQGYSQKKKYIATQGELCRLVLQLSSRMYLYESKLKLSNSLALQLKFSTFHLNDFT